MKKIVLTMVWLMVSAIIMAQNEVGHWTVIPKVGLNLATLTNPDIYVGMGGEKYNQLKLHNRVIQLTIGYRFE